MIFYFKSTTMCSSQFPIKQYFKGVPNIQAQVRFGHSPLGIQDMTSAEGSYCIALLSKPGVCWRADMASSQQAFFSSSTRSEILQLELEWGTDHVKISLRHNSSPGALSVQSK